MLERRQPEKPIDEFVRSPLSSMIPALLCAVRRTEVFENQTPHETISFWHSHKRSGVPNTSSGAHPF
jgi:hypothetical protein